MRWDRFWQGWLSIACATLAVGGLFIALANETPLFRWAVGEALERVFWPGAAPDSNTARFIGWIYGVLGATLTGWAILLAFVSRNAFAAGAPSVRLGVLVSTLAWFGIDTSISIYCGAYLNVVINLAIAVALALPLWLLKSAPRAEHSTGP